MSSLWCDFSVEYSASYVYHSLFAYFDRDNVALKGFAKFFKESSEEERGHAEKLMKYQNMRGGRVKLFSILMPPSDFEHAEKGDALYAMELALSLEKLVNEKLLNLHRVAEKNNDPQLQEFIEGEFLAEQVESIKKIAEYVTQLRMVGKGHGMTRTLSEIITCIALHNIPHGSSGCFIGAAIKLNQSNANIAIAPTTTTCARHGRWRRCSCDGGGEGVGCRRHGDIIGVWWLTWCLPMSSGGGYDGRWWWIKMI
ncbi:hypothetical protein KSS87_006640, partial [Heliosperma pusillum]